MGGSCRTARSYDFSKFVEIIPSNTNYVDCDNTGISNFLQITSLPLRNNTQYNYKISIGSNEFLITGSVILAIQSGIGSVQTSTFDNISPINNPNTATFIVRPTFSEAGSGPRDRIRFGFVAFAIEIFGEAWSVKYTFVEESFYNFFTIYVSITPGKKIITNAQVTSNLKTNLKISPSILIISQTLIDFSDIGNTLFEVSNDKKSNCLKIFEKHCPLIVSVLKGNGLTALDKVNYLYKKYKLNITTLIFGSNIIEYSMIRYFLGKLLYDKWNINILLNKYYKTFLKDLQNSKYNNFVEYFADPNNKTYGYNKYFLESKSI
jgi:hypothetical protein